MTNFDKKNTGGSLWKNLWKVCITYRIYRNPFVMYVVVFPKLPTFLQEMQNATGGRNLISFFCRFFLQIDKRRGVW